MNHKSVRQPYDFQQKMHNLAAELRQRTTHTEDILWHYLRNRQLDGYKFRRQFPVGGYVLDFYCIEKQLAVEIDGSIHDQQVEADRLRQEALEELNIRFARFTVTEIEMDLPKVIETIRTALAKS